jgi:hypothetical protein
MIQLPIPNSQFPDEHFLREIVGVMPIERWELEVGSWKLDLWELT